MNIRLAVIAIAAMPALALAADPPSCRAQSARTVTPVVELYTSEGCNSCPPADRWLSGLKVQPEVVALAFHVDYWDRLGWKDRFASAANTQRQTEQHSVNGARFSYTPQVVVNGADRKDWPEVTVPLAASRSVADATVDLSLTRDSQRFTATVQPRTGGPSRLAAYWAVTEQGHISAVKAGENQGVTLHHDFVVREWKPVAAWAGRAGTSVDLQFNPSTPADPAHPRQVNLIVVDAASGKPLQALKLGC